MTSTQQPSAVKPAEFARIAGFKPSYVTQLNRAGRLVQDAAGLILVSESLARIRDTSDPSKAGVAERHAAARAAQPDSAVGDAGEPDEDAPDAASGPDSSAATRRAESLARKEHFLALSAERDYLQSMGRLLPLEDVQAVVAQAAVSLRTRLEALPDTLAPQLAAEIDEARCRAVLAEAVEHALDEAARAVRGLMPAEGGE